MDMQRAKAIMMETAMRTVAAMLIGFFDRVFLPFPDLVFFPDFAVFRAAGLFLVLVFAIIADMHRQK